MFQDVSICFKMFQYVSICFKKFHICFKAKTRIQQPVDGVEYTSCPNTVINILCIEKL
jgi:hypothetical protein